MAWEWAGREAWLPLEVCARDEWLAEAARSLTVVNTACREAGPGMRHVVGGMRAAIHPDRPWTAVVPVHVERNELSRVRIGDLREPDVRRTAHRVHDNVRDALTLGNRLDRLVPGGRLEAGGLVDWQAGEITNLDAAPMRRVFIVPLGPFLL
jgi:hypothetical protein